MNFLQTFVRKIKSRVPVSSRSFYAFAQKTEDMLSQIQQTQELVQSQINAQIRQMREQMQQSQEQTDAQIRQLQGQMQARIQETQDQTQTQIRQMQEQIQQSQELMRQSQEQMQQSQEQTNTQIRQMQGQLQAQMQQIRDSQNPSWQERANQFSSISREVFLIKFLIEEKTHTPAVAAQLTDNLEQMLALSTETAFPVVFITDSNYAKPTAVAISSLIRNRSAKTRYQIYVLGDHLSAESRHLFSYFKNAVQILDASDKLSDIHSDASPLVSHVSKSALLKFMIPEIFPQHDKILYLDSDVLVRHDLTDLFSTDISSVYAGAVKDAYCTLKLQEHKVLGLSSYFNSGVLLLNLSRLRKDKISDRLLSLKNDPPYPVHFMDQNELNYGFSEQVCYLSPTYNWVQASFLDWSIEDLTKLYGIKDDRLYQIKEDPTILHFVSRLKPWHTQNALMSEEYCLESSLYKVLSEEGKRK